MNIELFGGECHGQMRQVEFPQGVINCGGFNNYAVYMGIGLACGGRRPDIRREYKIFKRKSGKWIPWCTAFSLETALLRAVSFGMNGRVKPMRISDEA